MNSNNVQNNYMNIVFSNFFFLIGKYENLIATCHTFLFDQICSVQLENIWY